MNNFETEGPTLHEVLVALGMICAVIVLAWMWAC